MAREKLFVDYCLLANFYQVGVCSALMHIQCKLHYYYKHSWLFNSNYCYSTPHTGHHSFSYLLPIYLFKNG